MFPDAIRLPRWRRFRRAICEIAKRREIHGDQENLYQMARLMNQADEILKSSRHYERSLMERLAVRILRGRK